MFTWFSLPMEQPRTKESFFGRLKFHACWGDVGPSPTLPNPQTHTSKVVTAGSSLEIGAHDSYCP